MILRSCKPRTSHSSNEIPQIFSLWNFRVRVAVFLLVLLGIIFTPSTVMADRSTIVEERAKAYHWILSNWKNGASSSLCNIYLVENRQPDARDILTYCGSDLEKQWSETPVCEQVLNNGDTSTCQGLFYWYAGIKSDALVKKTVESPGVSLQMEIGVCQPGTWCDQRPTLIFSANEPLDEYEITQIVVHIDEDERSCYEESCEMRLPLTTEDGAVMEYWAISSFGDESEHQFITFRNVASTAETPQYRLDLLQDAWKETLPTASLYWGVFPAIDDPLMDVFSQSESVEDLKTQNPLQYLAGQLIFNGKVAAATCSDSGISRNGMADACGLEVSRVQVNEWQNKYDEPIFKAAIEFNVPARILKGIITQETQFWTDGNPVNEWGFGQITENGADMLLSWNPTFYSQICIPHLGNEYCSNGYHNLDSEDQSYLRGVTIAKVGTDDEFRVLAATLKASTYQIDQMMRNTTGNGTFSEFGTEYDDLWKITIANYHSGSGCVGTAMQTTMDQSQEMTWTNISSHLLGGCQDAINYVSQVLHYAKE